MALSFYANRLNRCYRPEYGHLIELFCERAKR